MELTDFADQFHFLRPLWLLAILPALGLLIGLWRSQFLSQQWQKFVSPALLPYLLDSAQTSQKRWPFIVLFLAWALATLALAGPVWQKIPVPVQQNTSALVICWDLSPSMLAEDIKPSRLVKSRLKIIDLLKAKQDGQVGLIAYSGEAYVVTPLTDDFQTIINLLPALSPTTLPSVGSNPEMAVETAQKLLQEAGILQGHILLINDELTSDAMENIEGLIDQSPHQLTIWGVGTQEGAPIPLPQGGFAKGSGGDIVVAKLNEAQLQEFSRASGAYYIPMINHDSDVDTLMSLTSPVGDQTQQSERKIEQWFEPAQFWALLLLPIGLLLFRRGIIFALLLSLPILHTPPSYALSWQDLWKTQDQQAQEALERGDKDAAMQFTNPNKRGAELFKQGNFPTAAEEFAKGETAVEQYNRGVAQTFSGDLESAIKSFESALEQKPDFSEAQKNLAIAQQLKELQDQQKQEQQNQDQNSNENEEQNSSAQQNSSAGQQQDQNNQDGQNSSSQNSQQDPSENAQQNQDAEQTSQEQQGEQNSSSNLAEQNSSANSEDNPFATGSSSSADSSASAQKFTQHSSESGETQPEDSAVAMQRPAEQKPMTEEQQMLEQWLRKVPDDPSGLMRNKFRYQYLQRKEKMSDQFIPGQQSPEKRW